MRLNEKHAKRITFDSADIAFHAARIRRLAKHFNAEHMLPPEDYVIVACVGTVIGGLLAIIESKQ